MAMNRGTVGRLVILPWWMTQPGWLCRQRMITGERELAEGTQPVDPSLFVTDAMFPPRISTERRHFSVLSRRPQRTTPVDGRRSTSGESVTAWVRVEAAWRVYF